MDVNLQLFNDKLFRLNIYLISNIAEFLPIKDLLALIQTNKFMFEIFNNEKFWKTIFIRDFEEFYYTNQIINLDHALRKELTEKYKFKETNEEELKDYRLEETIQERIQQQKLSDYDFQQKLSQTKNFKTEYQSIYKKSCNYKQMNNCIFHADYSGHGLEQIRIVVYGYFIMLIKQTGDPNVPAGKLTFIGYLDENLQNAQGYIHLSKTGYHDSWYEVAQIQFQNNYQKYKVTWYYKNTDEQFNQFFKIMHYGINLDFIDINLLPKAENCLYYLENNQNNIENIDQD